MARLTDKTLAQSSAITPTTLIHIVYTGDPSQNPAGSSYKAELQQLAGLFSGLSFTGGTVSGSTVFTNGVTGSSISATTYQNLPVSGLTAGTNIGLVNNDGNYTISVTGITSGGGTFSGGTVTGATSFTNGLSANTISATTYQNLPISGTHNYLSKFSSGSTILVDSQIQDDGTSVSVGTTLSPNVKLNVRTSTQDYSIFSFNNKTSGIGILGQTQGIGNSIGVQVFSNGSTASTTNTGVYGLAQNATTTIGVRGHAQFGINNYSAQLQDGTEGVGKVLTCMTSDGKANWQIPTGGGGTFTGGTVTGATSFTGGLSANTLSATTYQNLPVSGLTEGSNISISGSNGNYTISVSIDPYNNVGSASTITWDVSGVSTNYEVTLTAATTLNLTNVRNGDYGTLIINQPPVGNYGITLGTVNGAAANHKVVNGAGSILLTSTSNAIDIITFTYNGSKMFWTVGNDYV